ncbi:MAG TPA: SDR family oxidoreductase [Thermoanaerobaculia bacterium]|nr:SDR family oxidoreductase [Thermoanaerobaculia bacterium]
MASIFFTGFPGFLGSELLPRILGRTDDRALCLIQPKFRALAEERARTIVAAHPQLKNRIELVEGDITAPLTSIDASDVREVWHLAAVYDLAVKRDLGMRVNVDGTRHVLDLAERAPKLERVHYVSTCYVSGRYEGRFTENDLEKGQTYNNFYEETKKLAEVDVRTRMSKGMPATIYRPSIVVGDSRTGVTQKYDGPYFVIQWLLRQPKVAVLPVVGRPRDYRLNVVPRDFIIDAIERLSSHPNSLGKTYALADPAPATVDETIDAIAKSIDHTVVRIPLPLSVAKGAIDYVPGVYRVMRIPSAAVDYFVHPTLYDTSNATRDLAGSGVSAPHLRDYLPALISFVRAHPEVGSAAMV